MRINTVNINFAGAPSLGSALINALLDNAQGITVSEGKSAGACEPPAIGEVWPGHGGIYIGLSRGEAGAVDEHLILHVAEADKKLPWAEAQKWASEIEVDGHKDFHVPTRFESALLYANARDLMETSGWYWTSTQDSDDYAWCQDFSTGYQDSGYGKCYEGRVKAVRRFIA